MSFDRFDIAEGYWVFAHDHHGGNRNDWKGREIGIDSHLKRNRSHHHFDIEGQLLEMGFRPRSDLTLDTLTERSREVYEGLRTRFGYEE